jgi:hypothetical protein
MQYRWQLIPAALMLIQPVHASVFMTLADARQLLFPGATFTEVRVTLTDTQVQAIEKASDTRVRNRQLTVWRVSGAHTGWFIADEVVGKHEFIPFALGLDRDGAVVGLEILEYREAYGGAVAEAAWRDQFVGQRYGAPLHLGGDIRNLSGATLSCKHLADGVRRLITTHGLVLAGG